MTMTILPWVMAAVVLPAGGWLACAWVYQRKIEVLQLQRRIERQTATTHYDQARNQIGVLQAQLAARPAKPRRPMPADETAESERGNVVGRFEVEEDGFAKTMLGPNGFTPTRLMDDGFAKTLIGSND